MVSSLLQTLVMNGRILSFRLCDASEDGIRCREAE